MLCAISVLLLACLLAFINGPGFRFAASKILATYGQKQSETAGYELSGSLIKGLQLKNLHLQNVALGDAGLIKDLKVGELNVAYRLIELIRCPQQLKWLQQLAVADVNFEIDLDPQAPKDRELARLPLPDFDAIWNLLYGKIDLTDIDLIVRNGEQQIVQLQGLGAYLAQDESKGSLCWSSLDIDKLPEIPAYEAPLIVGPDFLETSVKLDQWDIELKGLRLSAKRDGQPASLTGKWLTGGAIIDYKATSQSLELEMPKGHMDLGQIKALGEALPKLEGVVSTLDLDFFQSDLGWSLDGGLNVQNLGYDDFHASSADVQIDQIDFDWQQKIATRGEINLESHGLDIKGATVDQLTLTAKVAETGQVLAHANLTKEGENLATIDGQLEQPSLEYQVNGTLDCVLEELLASNHSETSISGSVDAEWQGSGSFNDNLSHTGLATLQLKQLKIKESETIHGSINLGYQEGAIQARRIDLFHKDGEVKLTGSADWSKRSLSINSVAIVRDDVERLRINGVVGIAEVLEESTADIQVEVKDFDPNDLATFFVKDLPIEGQLNGGFSAKGPFRQLSMDTDLVFSPLLASLPNQKPDVHLKANLSGDVTTPNTWSIDADAVISGLKYGDTIIEDWTAKLTTDDQQQLAAKIAVKQSGARLNGQLRAGLADAAELDSLTKIPLQGHFELLVPELQKLRQAFPLDAWKELPITGDLDAKLDDLVYQQGNLLGGRGTISAKALAFAGESFDQFSVVSNVVATNLVQSTLAVTLDPLAKANGTVTVQLEEKSYQSKLELNANPAGQGKLRRLLAGSVAADLLPEDAHLSWSGNGNWGDQSFRGQVTADVKNISLAKNALPLSMQLAGDLADDSADFPQITITGENLKANAAVGWKDQRLWVKDLQGQFKEQAFLSGSVDLPFDPKSLQAKQWFASQQPLSIKLDITDAPIDELARFATTEIPVTANLTANVSATGSPANPNLSCALTTDQLVLKSKTSGAPIELGQLQLNLKGSDRVATLNGAFSHPDINPLKIQGHVPFVPAEWASQSRDWQQEPLQLDASIEPTSLDFLAPRVPVIRSLLGKAELDLSVKGTVREPLVSGFSRINIDRLKLKDRNAPNIQNLKTLIKFDAKEARLEQFEATVAGGTLKASGTARLPEQPQDSFDPVLDLAIDGEEVLIYRNPDTNVRTSVDLALKGPWSELGITGEIGIDNSYYVKNIDVLPTSLPLIRRSKVPTVDSGASGFSSISSDEVMLAVPKELKPYANWTSDIRIHTRSPFLIRGNVGHGSATADIKITGPLSDPIPNGELLLSNETKLTLPFSRIAVDKGRIAFDESTGFNGQVEVKALGKAGEHNINIFLYNRIFAPKYVLTSDPDLPSGDILTLLATGNVRSDLVGGDIARLAASKASSLLLKHVRNNSNAQGRSAFATALRDRTEIDFDGFSLDSGAGNVSGRIRLWKQLFFVGNASWDDEYRALLKYVFGFR